MATAIHRTTFEVRLSVNTPDYDPASWIINPDLSALITVPQRYWKISGDLVLEMTQTEKDSKDAALAQAEIDNDRAASKVLIDLRDLTGILQIIVDELNAIRAFGQSISVGGFVTLTNVGSTYDAITASKGLGAAIVDFTGISSLIFGVFVNKIGTGTQSWQLWNVTDGIELGVIEDAGATGEKILQITINSGLPNGIKLVRVRSKSTTAADDPIYYGGSLLLNYPARTYTQARNAILNRIDSI